MSSMIDMWKMQTGIGWWCKKTFPDQDVGSISLHFSEEVIELQDSVIEYMRSGANPSTQSAVGEEIADCIILLLALADNLEINAAEHVRKKMQQNYRSKWEYDPALGYHKKVKN
jgi:NTP pyrophosphatase (non-canonical NTP hydrolase)